MMIAAPYLSVARPRLALKLDIILGGAEEHVRHFVFRRAHDIELILIAAYLCPAMRSLEVFPKRSVIRMRVRSARARLMDPSRLRHADSSRRFVSMRRVQQ